jgi:prolyl-tRNA editing enzyme YbaK/EbsC (Cys-tRNA(Pro) deacylase)
MTQQTELLHPKVNEAIARYGINAEAMACDPNLADTAAFLANYDFTADNTANTIVGIAKSNPPKYACCVVLANSKVDINKRFSELVEVKRCSFASGEQTLELTGMEIGGVTPVGLPDDMPVYVDAAIMAIPRVLVGGGNRSSKLILAPEELKKIPQVQIIEGLGIPR